MYKDFFGFNEAPFSIVPNSRYLFLSQRHQEAMQHLQAGLGDGGGFAMLTGEVGTGKTTVARAMLANLDSSTKAGLILNPTFSSSDLLEAICDEFSLKYPEQASLKQLSQTISHYLIENHGKNIQTLLVIDEAQHLAAEVLEQLRLLTNLETDQRKLLKVLLVGQPELQQQLQTTQLRQLAQRITGRYHLLPLNVSETGQYIDFRIKMAGGSRDIFQASSIKVIAQATQGIPRLINLVCDKSLQYAHHHGEPNLSVQTVKRACHDVMQYQVSPHGSDINHSKKSSRQALSTQPVWKYLSALSLGSVLAVASYNVVLPYIDVIGKEAQQGTISTVQMTAQQQNIDSKDDGDAGLNATTADDNEISIPAELVNVLQKGASQVEAIQELYKLWGYQASVRDGLCTENLQSLFICDTKKGRLVDLIKQQTPVVLLLSYNHEELYAVLYAASKDQVEILIGQQRVQMSSSMLQSLWSSEYYAIWKSELRETLKKSQRSEKVRILERKLSLVLGEPSLDSPYFDSNVEQKVKTFQRWQNMSVDGIAGKQTLQRLEQLAQPDAPKLRTIEPEVA
ncbi:AAA family ATPase [Vibrio cortegadensis]|uniref:AAA family ATPase n=1 Tax=Vibrio cortegadensis TaxID=1328770 RepID=UPI0021C288A1|nr:AAA family ATPase [Vibrio cortegadensis]MDN3699468.1 AAA family ATPase [Vibrio cortegadensis]